mmetsp:Transcript_9937/g.22473  ORF Transcript_9937/g.22473 Transcript_9937/m.22473 type:complete len:168 (+) Transcript_9937:1033-1536(+)
MRLLLLRSTAVRTVDCTSRPLVFPPREAKVVENKSIGSSSSSSSSSSSNNLSRLSLLTRALEQQPEKDAMVDSKSNLPRLGLKVRTTAALQPPTAAAAATTTTTTPPPAGSPHDNHPFLRTMPVEDDNGGSGAEMTTTTSSSPYTLRSPPRDIPHPNWHKTRSSHNH